MESFHDPDDKHVTVDCPINSCPIAEQSKLQTAPYRYDDPPVQEKDPE
jgi:hypothetical protein